MTREVIARTPPPAFLFPINNVKDPTASAAPPFNARRRRGGRCLIAPEIHVNRFFRAVEPFSARPAKEAWF